MSEGARPRRVVVDAMNVLASRPTGWWRDRPAALAGLVERLAAFAAREGVALTVVLEGARLTGIAEGPHAGIEVRYARRRGRNAADDRIVELVAADADPASLLVVTSDRELASRVRAAGAGTTGARAFLGWVEER